MEKIIPAGTKINITLEVGYTGMDSSLNYILTRDYTETELNDTCWDMALCHAESYGYYNIYDYSDEDLPDEDDPESDCYVDTIEGWWGPYDENEHAGRCYNNDEFIEL